MVTLMRWRRWRWVTRLCRVIWCGLLFRLSITRVSTVAVTGLMIVIGVRPDLSVIGLCRLYMCVIIRMRRLYVGIGYGRLSLGVRRV